MTGLAFNPHRLTISQSPFYETWWFSTFFCIGIGLMVWLIIYLRTQLILKQNRWLLQKVNERTEELKKQYEWQQRLFASITHDIKTPLNYVVKALQAMHDTAGEKGVAPDELEQIYRSIQHIYHYSNNLTKLAKVMITKEWLQLTDVCLYQITQKQIVIFQSIAESRGNTIYNSISPHTTAHAHADILSVIIHNILDNAIKFTKDGEICIRAEQNHAGRILFSISDTGVGLYPELTAYYNDPLHTQEKTAHDDENIGLGLMLAKDMAHLIHAEMTVQSTLGKGTTVTFALHQYGEN